MKYLDGELVDYVPFLAVVSACAAHAGKLPSYLGCDDRRREPGGQVLDLDLDSERAAPIFAVKSLGSLTDTDQDRFEQFRVLGYNCGNGLLDLVVGTDRRHPAEQLADMELVVGPNRPIGPVCITQQSDRVLSGLRFEIVPLGLLGHEHELPN